MSSVTILPIKALSKMRIFFLLHAVTVAETLKHRLGCGESASESAWQGCSDRDCAETPASSKPTTRSLPAPVYQSANQTKQFLMFWTSAAAKAEE